MDGNYKGEMKNGFPFMCVPGFVQFFSVSLSLMKTREKESRGKQTGGKWRRTRGEEPCFRRMGDPCFVDLLSLEFTKDGGDQWWGDTWDEKSAGYIFRGALWRNRRRAEDAPLLSLVRESRRRQ